MDWKAVVAGIFALIAIGLILANGKDANTLAGTLISGVTSGIAELERMTPKGETVSNAG